MKILQPTPEAIEAFARRAISQLPDKLSDQKSDLLVLIKLLPRKSRSLRAALAMWHALDQAEQAQNEFCFTENRPKHDGQHNGGNKS